MLLKKDDGFSAQITGESPANPTETSPGTTESAISDEVLESAPIDISKFSDLELMEFEQRMTTLKYKKQRYLNVSWFRLLTYDRRSKMRLLSLTRRWKI